MFVVVVGNFGLNNDNVDNYLFNYVIIINSLFVVVSYICIDGDSGYLYGIEIVDIVVLGIVILFIVLGNGYVVYLGILMVMLYVVGVVVFVWLLNLEFMLFEMKELLMFIGEISLWVDGCIVFGNCLNVFNVFEEVDLILGFKLGIMFGLVEIEVGEIYIFIIEVGLIVGYEEEV